MPNQAGIDDHSGENAEKLAAGYKSIETPRREMQPKLFAAAEAASGQGQVLEILDIGSGSGNDAFALAQLGHYVTAIEPSDLRRIAERDHAHDHIEYLDGKLPDLACIGEGNTYDLTLLSAVMQYVDPLERCASLVNIAGSMKPGGKMFISYPSPPSRPHQFEVTPEALTQDIQRANTLLPPSKRLTLLGEPEIQPDSRGRLSADGRPIKFYSYEIGVGRIHSIPPRGDRGIG